MTGLDKLIDEVITLRLLVGKLAAEVATLKQQVSERDGEAAALKTMLLAWPVSLPDALVMH